MPSSPSLRLFLPACLLALGVAAQAQPLKPQPGAASKSAAAKPSGPTAITVGTVTIKKNHIDTLANLMARARGADLQALPPEQAMVLRRMVATNLIGQELLELEAKARGLQASPREIDSAVKLLKAQFPDAAAWQRAMRKSGDSEADVRNKVARQLRADKVLAAGVARATMPTEADLKAFWGKHKQKFPVNDSLRAVQILLLADASTPAEAANGKKRRLEGIRRELAADSAEIPLLLRRFMAEAQQAGEGPEARIGGDLERFHPDDFHPSFKKEIANLRVGEMSSVFRTPLGFHLVLLIEKYDGKFESYQLQILQNLMAQKNAEMGMDMREFLKKLGGKYPVKYLIPSYRDASESGIY
jgi:peptidyl-prolyl cis-trans isomerase C